MSENINQDSHKIWLVKQGQYILGPFSTVELSEKIQIGEIKISNEATLPMKFWKPIYIWPELNNVLRQIRNPEHVDEATRTLHLKKVQVNPESLNKNDSDSNITVKNIDPDDDFFEKTQKEKSYPQSDTYFDKTEPIDIKKNEDIPSQDSSSQDVPVEKTFDYEGSDEAVSQSKKNLSGLIALTVVVVASIVVFLFYKEGFQKPIQKKIQIKNYKNEALKKWDKGDLKGSLESFKKAYGKNKSLDSSSLLYAGLLLHNLETSRAREIYKQISDKKPEQRQVAQNGLGLSHFYDDQLNDSLIYFKDVLKKDSSFSPSHINLGILYLKRKGYEKSLENFQKASKIEGRTRILNFLIGLTYFMWGDTNSDPTYLNQSLQFLKRVTDNIGKHYQEALFLSALIYEKTGQTQQASSLFSKILDIDPNLNQDYRPALSIYTNFFSWKDFFESCKNLASQSDIPHERDTFVSFCHIKSGQIAKSKSILEGLSAQYPDNSLVKSYYAYVLSSQGLLDEASIIIGSAIEKNINSKNKLPYLLQGNFCYTTKRYDCAVENFENIFYKLDGFDPSVYAGLAKSYWKTKNQAKAQKFLDKGIKLDPEYIPFLELKGGMK